MLNGVGASERAQDAVLGGGKSSEVQKPAQGSPSSSKKIELIDYLAAGCPLIHVRTVEDERGAMQVKAALSSLNNKHSVPIFYGEWKVNSGLRIAASNAPLDINSAPPAEQPTRDINNALAQLRERFTKLTDNPVLVCLYNVRQFIGNPVVIQNLKDAAFAARDSGSYLVLVGPYIEFPPELASMVTVYKVELPNKDQIADQFQECIDSLPEVFGKDGMPTKEDVEVAATHAVGLPYHGAENALALSLAKTKSLDLDIIRSEKEQAVRRGDVLEFVNANRGITDLGGFDQLKDWLIKRQDSFTKEAQEYGLEFPKGILVVGIPGAGKSLTAKVVASYLRLPLIKLDMGRVFKGVVGGSEQTIMEALQIAETVSPCVLWIEEIEKALSGMGSSGSSDGGTTARVIGHILMWMQENTKPVFVYATANDVTKLPPELLRKGRFSEIFGVIEPTSVEREDIWKIQIRRRRPDRVSEFDYPVLSTASNGFTGAEIEEAVKQTMYDCFYDGKREMQTADLLTTLEKMVPQSHTNADHMTQLREWMKTKVRLVSSVTEEEATKTAGRKIRTRAMEV